MRTAQNPRPITPPSPPMGARVLKHTIRERLRPHWQTLGRHRRDIAMGGAAFAFVAILVLFLLARARADLVAPAPTLLVRDRHDRFVADLGSSDEYGRGYWRLDAIPERVAAATLAIEDRRFARHPGVDPLAIARAVRQNWAGRRVSGASTIAMQVARMQSPGRRRYARKLLEAATALVLVQRHGRDAVLSHYLTLAPYGNDVHGIAYAARYYFDKPVDDLSWAETAFLAALPQAPGRMNPRRHDGRERARRRAQLILTVLHRDATLNDTDYVVAAAQLAALRLPPPPRRPEAALHAILALEEILGARERAATPIVRTTLDLELQGDVSLAAMRAVDEFAGRGAGNAAVILVDRETHEVLAYVGSTGYFGAHGAGSIDFAATPRSPGSALKPFLYARALERGRITPVSVLDDLGRAPGEIENSDRRFLGPMLPRQALANSRNVPAAVLLADLGLDDACAMLRDLGLHDGRRAAARFGLGLAIGAMDVTLVNLVQAYTTLASDGTFRVLRWVMDEPRAATARRVFSESTARYLTQVLADPMARLPTFPRMGTTEYPFPVALKTGTSSHHRDAWTVAWSRRYLLGAWIGHPDARPMNGVTGSSAAAALVQSILTQLHEDDQDGLADVPFPPPRGHHEVRLCAQSGRRATESCERVVDEWLAGETPTPPDCTWHVRRAIDRRSGELATSATPRVSIDVRPFARFPARYAAWAAAGDLPIDPLSTSGRGDTPPAREPAAARVSITSPEDGSTVLRDPDTPPGLSTLALAAVVDPPSAQIVWYVDGAPFQVADYPYAARWPLTKGEHVFEARLAFAPLTSRPVRVVVE